MACVVPLPVVVRLLAKWGQAACEARGGREALARIAADRPRLVLLDMHMPGMTGLEVLERLGSLPAAEAGPAVAVVSADGTDESRSRAERLGARAYLVKGLFTAADLRATVDALLH